MDCSAASAVSHEQSTDTSNAVALTIPELVRCFGVLSHDLKSPIFTIDGFSDLLLLDHGDKLGEEGEDFLRRIRSSAAVMKKVIERMNSIVKMLSRPASPVEIDIPELLDEIRLQHNFLFEDGELEIEHAENLPQLRADREMVKEMLAAMVVNAVEFNDRLSGERRLRVRAEKGDDSSIRFIVSDNGIGIDPRWASQIFELGIKMDKSRGEGPGYGLFMARKVATLHGGRLDVQSALGEGSTFTATLPL